MAEGYKYGDKLPETPVEWQRYWKNEFQCARTPRLKRWHDQAKRADRSFTVADSDTDANGGNPLSNIMYRLNIFNSNVTMQMSMLYGRIPKAEVTRRFADSNDDVSRVAGLMLTRILNQDIEVAGEDMASVFRAGLQDRLIAAHGSARVQYQFEEGEVVTPPYIVDGIEMAPEVRETKIVKEWVDIVYTNWEDILWKPSRTYAGIGWKAYRTFFSKRMLKERFTELTDEECARITFSAKNPLKDDKDKGEDYSEPLAEVWEIWDRDNGKVFWFNEDASEPLQMDDDILGLKGMYPEPPPMVANVSTRRFMPKPDYEIARQLYVQIDELETRIRYLVDACKLVGIYDKKAAEIKRIFNEGTENQLIPVDNWAMFADKGGIKGALEWLPLKEVAETIDILTTKQALKIQQLQQVTGMSDVMRGAASARTQRVSATQDKLETQFGSMRIEALQNEFARWVTDIQAKKVEIIQLHYQPESIIKQSNIMMTDDAKYAEAAVALIKDPEQAQWRIMVRPETLAIADYAQLKQDRSEFIFAFAQFMQSSAPILELSPMALPTLLKLLKWFLSGFRGSNEAEAFIDEAITNFEKAPPKQDKPDPQVEKAKFEMQQSQQEHQQKMEQNKSQFEAKMAENQQKFQLAIAEMREEARQNQQEFMMEMRFLRQKLNLEVTKEVVQAQTAMAEKEHAAKVSVQSGNKGNGGS